MCGWVGECVSVWVGGCAFGVTVGFHVSTAMGHQVQECCAVIQQHLPGKA